MVVRFGSVAPQLLPQVSPRLSAKPAAPAAKIAPAPTRLHVVTDAVEQAKSVPTLPPFELALPACEAQVAGMPKHKQADSAAALIGTLGEMAKEGLTVESLKQVCERASELQAHPEQSVMLAVFGDDVGAKILAGLSEVTLDSSELEQLGCEYFGADAGPMLRTHVQQVKAFFAQVIEVAPTPEKPIFGMSEAQTVIGLQTVQQVLASLVHAPGSVAPPLFPSQPLQAGAQQETGLASGVQRLLALGEAGLEMLIALAGKLAQGDHTAHLTQLQGSLEALKQQKLGLVKQIHGKEAELQGNEYLASTQAEEARKAAEAAKNCAIVGAVFAVIVAVILVVLAVALAVCTFGAGIGATIPIIMGGVLLGVTTITAATLACVTIMAVCAAITAVMTIIANLPNLIRLAAVIMKAAGNDGLAQTLENAAKWFEDNVTNTEFFKTFNMVVTMACALVSAVCSFGVSAANEVLELVGKVVSIGVAAMSIGSAVFNFIATKVRLEAEYALSLLKGQLAKVEVAIKRLLNQIRQLENKEEHEQQRLRDAEETQEQLMKNLSACVDSLLQIRTEVSSL